MTPTPDESGKIALSQQGKPRLDPAKWWLKWKVVAYFIVAAAGFEYFGTVHGTVGAYLTMCPLVLTACYPLALAMRGRPPRRLTIWLRARLPGIRLPLAKVFLTYLVTILWFGGLYATIYGSDPKSVLFSSDITDAEAARYLRNASTSLSDLRRAKLAADHLTLQLAERPVGITNEDFRMGREFKIASATIRFWIYGSGNGPPEGWAGSVTDDHQRRLWLDRINWLIH